MKKNRLLFLLMFIFTFHSYAQSPITIAQHVEVTEKLDLLEIWVNEQMEYYNLPGLSMGIVYDQELIWAKGFGYANVEKQIPMTPKTIFRIASITKLFTSTAIMQLRDAGKLSLNDPIRKYLPWFKIKNRFPDEPEITIWHILTHTSGLPREAAFPYWTDRKFPSLEQIKEKLPQQETIFPPETKWEYSNLAMALLGAIVEAASGEKYEIYIKKHILDPLNMRYTNVIFPKEQKDLLATGYGIRLPDGTRQIMALTDTKGLIPAANITSNIIDLAKFISAQFAESNQIKKEQILKASTLRQMHRVQWLNPSWSSGWGLGFGIRHYGNRTLIGHGGWVGGYRSQIYFDKKSKVGVVVFSNGEDGSPAKFALKIFDIVVPAIEKVVAPPKKAPVFSPYWEKFVGKYQDPWHWVEEVVIQNYQLYLYGFSYPPDDNPEKDLVQLTPVSKNTFRMTGENGNGELVTFELDKDGNVIRMKKGENFLYPVKK